MKNFKTESKIAYRVKPHCFYPAPNVDSVLLLVKVIKTDCEPNLEAKFLKFVQDIFVQRRKTIQNNLNQYFKPLLTIWLENMVMIRGH